MKKNFTLLILFLFSSTLIFGTGVAVIDPIQGTFFELLESHVDVNVNNQISVTKSTQVFKNTSGIDTKITYAFPLSENASTTSIRWKINGGSWSTANLIAEPQDSSLAGNTGNTVFTDLETYLGATPLYFELEDIINSNNEVTIELTYVELLDYNNNVVQYTHRNDYTLIQINPINLVSFNFQMTSARDIIYVDLLSSNNETVNLQTTQASISWNDSNYTGTDDYSLEYELDDNQLGLFSFSTFIPDSLNSCDSTAGFFALIVEPDGTDSTAVIDKVFTLVVDVSGSMGGTKIVDAQNAATFIVNNMNFNDEFNIVKFSSSASSWKPNHVQATAANQNDALNYINSLSAGGGTSFTSALNITIPQFSFDTTVANVIIFITDGQANESDATVLSNLSNLVTTNNLLGNIQLHTFGIGSGTNQTLLSQMATTYDGVASFVGNNDFYDALSSFYSYIQNPVLLNVQAAFSPSAIIYDVYPDPLTNLYKGQQMIVVGKYTAPDSIQATFSGHAFGNPTSFQYDFTLADSLVPEHQFLTKVWAKMKIDNLMRDYYNAGSDTLLIYPLEDEITNLSICYGIVSPFTSYSGFGGNSGGSGTGNGGGSGLTASSPFLSNDLNSIDKSSEEKTSLPPAYVFPNPFSTNTTISFNSNNGLENIIVISIYDSNGRIIKVINTKLNGYAHDITWDGTTNYGKVIPNGTYVYSIEINGEQQYVGKIIKLDK